MTYSRYVVHKKKNQISKNNNHLKNLQTNICVLPTYNTIKSTKLRNNQKKSKNNLSIYTLFSRSQKNIHLTIDTLKLAMS